MKKPVLLAMLILGIKLAPAQRAISKEEALDVAHRLETASNNGDVDFLNHFIYVDSLLGRIRQNCESMQDPEFFQGYSSSFAKSFIHYGEKIQASVKQGDYRLLRQYESKGTQHLLFRMFGIGGLNYHDYILARVGDSIKASDVFVYTIDEELSENLSGLVNTMMLSYSKEKLPEESTILVRMTDEFKKKNYALVKEDYEKLEEKYKGNKGIEVIYINSCHQLDPVLYQTALEHFVARHPDAPSAWLMMIDLYYLRKENEKGLAAIDKMDKIIGGDPTLDVLRGNFYTLSGKGPEGRACYERAYHADPAIAINNRLLIITYEGEGEKAKAKTVITEFKKTPAYHEDDFADLLTKYPDLK